MTIRDHITPYDRHSWEAVQSAFCEYLSRHKTHAIQVRQSASNQTAKTLDALETYRQEYKQYNPHLLGNGNYTNTGICLMNPDERSIGIVSLDYHANGVPIRWGKYGKPRTLAA